MSNTFAQLKKTVSVFLHDHVAGCQHARYLLAVSGGGDSVLLAHLFHSLNLEFGISHVNYGLRGSESDADAVFVKNLAKKFNVPFHFKKVHAKALKAKGESIQMLARDVRYAFFEDLLRDEGYDCIVLAHHGSDQVETVLMNLFRGCGTDGLTGMDAVNEKKIRPLLSIAQAEIKKALKEKRIRFRTDSSNLKNDYKRNYLRNVVIPAIEKQWPGVEKTMLRNIENFTSAALVLSGNKQDHIDFSSPFTFRFSELNEVAKANFVKTAHANGFQATVLKKILKKQSGESKLLKGKSGLLEIKHDRILYMPQNSQTHEPVVKIEGNDLIVSGIDTGFLNRLSECISLRSIKGKPVLKKWGAGDKMMPLGMKNQKKISDLLTERKLTLSQKKNVYLLHDDEKALWLVGFRIDERVKLTGRENSNEVLNLRIV
jgi:tRNA(Ile)-lysidine synthase